MNIATNKKFIRNERVIEILEAVAKLGFIFFLGVAAPNAAGHIIKLLGWIPDYRNKYRAERILHSLENRKYIRFWYKNGKGKLELTHEGKMYIASLKVRAIKLPSGNRRWDGMWRMATFDIPEKLKINRRRFTRALNFAGMYNLEKSVFVYPYECKKEIFKIAEFYLVQKYVRYIIANSIEPDIKIKNNFPYTK